MGKIDEAITATEAPIPMVTVRLNVSSGRPVAVLVPADLTVGETLDLTSFVASGLQPELERRRPSRPKLAIATGPLPQALRR